MIDQEMLNHLVKTFHLSLTYLRIYPPTSQLVSTTIDSFSKTAIELADKSGTLTFSELSGRLLVDGIEPSTKEVQQIASIVLKLFSQKKIQSVTFRSGISKEEILDFLTNIIRKKREELPNFPHIALDQTVYVAMVKGEDAVVKITELVRNSGGEMSGLITSLRESFDLIEQLPDANSKVMAQDHLAQEMAKQDPQALREIFDRELPPKIEQSGIKRKLLGILSQDKVQEIFGEISGWYDAIRKKESSDFAAVEQLEKLKYFIQAILQAPAAKEVPRQFFEDLLQKGLLSQLPEWFSAAPSKPTSVFEVERIIEKPAADLVSQDVVDSLPQLVEKLCIIEYDELLGKLIEKILENFSNSASKIRLPAIQAIVKIYDILQAHGKEALMKYIELPVLESAKKETSPDAHFLLMELLRLRARQNILLGDYELGVRIIELLRQHTSAEVISDSKIRANADKSLALLIPNIMPVLISDLKSDNERKRAGSLQILAKMGSKAVEPLIQVIKESDDIRSRKLAALALKSLGEQAKKRFLDELNLGLTGPEITRVVEALGDLGNNDTIEQLNSLILYPDAGVKKEIMHFLSKLNSSQSKILLIEQLKDTDYAVVSEAVRLIGETKCREAVPALIKLLESSAPAAIEEEVCVVLGNLGDPNAVTALAGKLRKKNSWFAKKTSAESERVRMRAAWALRKFSGGEVEQVLEKAVHDKVMPVALTAKESLAVIRQAAAAKQAQKQGN